MPLRPEDVVRHTFNSARFRGGYVVEEVDAFLEEVVAELKRLTTTVDEQLAEISTLRSGGGTTAHDLEVERAQLEQVRRERDDVVTELAAADQQVLQARAAAQRAEEAKNASLEEIRARFDDDLLDVERRVTAAQEAADSAEEASRKRVGQAQERARDAEAQTELLARKLSTVSTEIRAVAAEHLGAETVDELDPFSDGLEHDPVAQAGAVAALVERIRRDHLNAGEREAQRLVGEATLERDALLAEAHTEHERLLSEAQRQHDVLVLDASQRLKAAQAEVDDLLAAAHAEGERAKQQALQHSEQLLTAAQQQHDEVVQRAQRAHDDLLALAHRERAEQVRQATAEATRLVDDAQVERAAVLADLGTRRDALEARVADLEAAQREYLDRLRTLVTGQLAALEAEHWERDRSLSR